MTMRSGEPRRSRGWQPTGPLEISMNTATVLSYFRTFILSYCKFSIRQVVPDYRRRSRPRRAGESDRHGPSNVRPGLDDGRKQRERSTVLVRTASSGTKDGKDASAPQIHILPQQPKPWQLVFSFAQQTPRPGVVQLARERSRRSTPGPLSCDPSDGICTLVGCKCGS